MKKKRQAREKQRWGSSCRQRMEAKKESYPAPGEMSCQGFCCSYFPLLQLTFHPPYKALYLSLVLHSLHPPPRKIHFEIAPDTRGRDTIPKIFSYTRLLSLKEDGSRRVIIFRVKTSVITILIALLLLFIYFYGDNKKV